MNDHEKFYYKQSWDQNIFQQSCKDTLHREYYFSYRELLLCLATFIITLLVDRYLLLKHQ
jgi:hypothetical protein